MYNFRALIILGFSDLSILKFGGLVLLSDVRFCLFVVQLLYVSLLNVSCWCCCHVGLLLFLCWLRCLVCLDCFIVTFRLRFMLGCCFVVVLILIVCVCLNV